MARNEDKWGRNEWEGRGIKRADEFTRTPRSAKTFLRDGNADRCSGIRTENKTDVFHDSAPPIYSEFLWFLRLAIRDSDFGWVGGRREIVKKTKENTRGRRP